MPPAATIAPVEAPAPDPMERGLDSLRAAGREPLRIWKVKGPKGVGGTISAVFCQDSNEVVLLHQLPSGKFGVFGKVEAPSVG